MVHPTWYGLTQGDAHSLPFAHAVEVYNHGSEVEVDRGYSWAFLDVLLNEGWKLSGYAVDDAHMLVDDWLGGWVMVQAEENDPDALLDSLKSGRYYSSQGPELHDVGIVDGKIEVCCSPARPHLDPGQGFPCGLYRRHRDHGRSLRFLSVREQLVPRDRDGSR